MFGVTKEQLIKGLYRISCRLCGYLGATCDCKYMQISEDFRTQSGEETGCPETAMAATLLNAMTKEEFNILAQRAGIYISNYDEGNNDLKDFLKKMRKQRFDQTIGNK
jgi:hypothetical protein